MGLSPLSRIRPHSLMALLMAGAVLITAAATTESAHAAASCTSTATRTTCTYSTVGRDSFTVPAGVTHLWVTAIGGGGGGGGGGGSFGGGAGGAGGSGATVTSSYVPVTPGSTISLFVGGGGQNGVQGNGYNGGPPQPRMSKGGGGGGATTFEYSAAAWVIAGGGGGGGDSGAGGNGGAGNAAAGGNGTLAGYSGRCAGSGGGSAGAGSAGSPGIVDGGGTTANCGYGTTSVNPSPPYELLGAGQGGTGGIASLGGTVAGGAGPSASHGIGGSASTSVYEDPAVTGAGGGGGYGGGMAGGWGAGAGAGGSIGPSGGGSTTTYSPNAGNGGNVVTSTAAGNGSVTVAYPLGTQSISFTSTPSSAVVNAVYTPAATGGASGNSVTFSIADASSGVCTIAGGIVTFDHVGSCVINANQLGSIDYREAPAAQQTVTVGRANQTISFSSGPPSPDPVYGTNGWYRPTVTGGAPAAGTPVVISIDPSSTSGCYVDVASNVIFGGDAGSCVVNADKAGSADYDAAARIQQTITVARAPQTVAFTSTAPTPAYGSNQTYTPTASRGASGNAVIFTIDSGSSSVCSISGGAVSFNDYGHCVINANQPGNRNYAPATQVQQTVTVLRPQTITITQLADFRYRVGTMVEIAAMGGGSTSPVVLRSASPRMCTVSGTTATLLGYGPCEIWADQAGDADYAAAPDSHADPVNAARMTFITNVGFQSITYTSTAPAAAVDGTYTPTATGGGSGNPVTFSLTAESSGVCTIDGGVVTFNHVGTCTVAADQASSPMTEFNYFAAPQARQPITVAKADQTVAFTTTASDQTFGQTTPYMPAASGGRSGIARVFTIDASSSGVCTIDVSGVVTFQHAGTCRVNADQAGNDDYNAAAQVQQAIPVAKADQAVAFTSTAPSPVFGDGSTYTPTASGGSSGIARVFTIDASSSGVCTIDVSGVVTFQHAGSCVVAADQAGNGDYNAAPQAQQAITVAKRPQTTAFTSSAGGSPRVRDTYAPAASDGGSGVAREFSIDATSSGVCSIAAGVVTFDHVGTCRVNAMQPGDDDHLPAPQVQQAITVGKAIQLIAITSNAPSPTYGDGSAYTPLYGGGYSSRPLALAVADAASGICTLASGTVTFQHAGTCTLTLDRGGDDDYLAAAQATQDITIARKAQTVAFTSSADGAVVDGTYTPAASGGTSGNARAFALTSGSLPYCSIEGGVVTFNHVGTCTITANQAGDGDHLPAPEVTQAVTIGKATQIVAFSGTIPTPTYGDGSSYTPPLTGGRSTQPSVVTVDGPSAGICSIAAGVVTFQHAGTCTLNVNRAGDDDYDAAPQQQRVITVAQAPQAVAFTSTAPAPTYGDGSSYTPTTSGGGSGNPRVLAIAPASSGICSLTSGTITFQHAGSCVVNADQAGTSDHLAGSAQQTITVAKAPQTITFTTTAPTPVVDDATSYAPATTGGSSGNAVVLTAVGEPADTCVDTGGTITFPHGGTCTITATQAGTSDYLAAPAVRQVITVQPAAQTVAFTSTPPTDAIATGGGYRPTADGSVRGTAIEFAAGGACLLRGDVIAPISAGICTVTARRAASRDYIAIEATQTYVVGPAPVTAPPAQVTVTASPRAAGTAAVANATVSWPASAFASPVTVSVTTVDSPTMSFAAGQRPIRLIIRDASGAEITSFSRPLELVFGKASGIPGYSRDGRTWTAMPELTGTSLPAGYLDGWYRAADGAIHVLTLHATDFGVLKAGSKVRSALIVTATVPRVVRLASSPRLNVTITTSLPAKTTFVLRTANGTRTTLRASAPTAARSSVVRLVLPARVRRPGRCTLIVTAKAGRETASTRSTVRLVGGAPAN